MRFLEEQLAPSFDAVEVWDEPSYASLLPHPKPDAHKYSRGHLQVIAGSGSYPGAAVLCSDAAAHSGAGYVSLAVPQEIVAIAQTHLLTVPVRGFASMQGAFAAEEADVLLEAVQKADAVVCGPGLTVTAGTVALLQQLLVSSDKPLLLDADALNALRACSGQLSERRRLGYPLIITPHEGEARRLLELTATMEQGAEEADIAGLFDAEVTLAWRVQLAQVLSRCFAACVVFKGPVTIIVGEGRVIISDHGTPALASAGTGDVLSGIIGALLAQGLLPLQAAALGVYLHGCAARIATRKVSDICMVATDVIDALGEAVLALEQDGGR